MNPTTKHLMTYAGYAAPEIAQRAQHLVRLTVNDVLGVLYKELHPQAYAQVLQTIQQRYGV